MDAKGIELYSCWDWRRKILLVSILNIYGLCLKFSLAKIITRLAKTFLQRPKNGDRYKYVPSFFQAYGRNTLHRKLVVDSALSRDGLVFDD
jgi:hypothetical protein